MMGAIINKLFNDFLNSDYSVDFDDEYYYLQIRVGDVSKEDIEVEVNRSRLIIYITRKGKNGEVLRNLYTFGVGSKIVPSDVSAKLENGILTVKIKREKSVKIKVE